MSPFPAPGLLLLLVIPLALADISSDYHNYKQNNTVCGSTPLNKRVNSSVVPVGRAPYVTYGEYADYGEWPFVAVVYLSGAECTGVIVTQEIVITAGHCLEELDLEGSIRGVKTELKPKTEAYVIVGKYSFFKKKDKFEVKHDVKAVQVGAYYRLRKFHKPDPDFARLWLRKPIEYNNYTQPVCISVKPETVYKLARTKSFFIGTGHSTDYDSITTRTHSTQWMQMVSNDPSFWTTGVKKKEPDDNVKFSADNHDSRLTCLADAGGPLVALDGNKRWVLVGIVLRSSWTCGDVPSKQPEDTFLLMAKIVDIFAPNFTMDPNESAT